MTPVWWVVLIVCVAFVIFLMTLPVFWLIVGGIAGLASLFACIASVIHFQILAAVGFFILTIVIGGVTFFLAELTEKIRE